VFFIMVSLPAVTAPRVAMREPEIPMACCIISQPRSSMRAATIGETKAVSVAWCQPRSRIPGNAASHRRISNSWPSTMPTINSRPSLPARSPQASAAGMMSDGCDGSCFQ